MEDKRGPGHPRKYMPDELENKFKDYIKYCIKKSKFPNIAGFCVFAEMHVDTFYNYKENYPEYSDAIKSIEQELLEVSIQQGTFAKNPAFMIFYLKNKFGWVDKQEINTTGETTCKINLDGLSTQDLKELLKGD